MIINAENGNWLCELGLKKSLDCPNIPQNQVGGYRDGGDVCGDVW